MAKTVIKANIERFGPGQLILNVDPNQLKWLADFKGMDLTVEFKPYKSQRSLNQNNLLWALLDEIDIAENGRASDEGQMAIYCNLIKLARVKTMNYKMPVEALEQTKKLFRHVEIIENDGVTISVIGYLGTSHFDTKQMADFIEATLDYASKLGLNLTEYKELRNGKVHQG